MQKYFTLLLLFISGFAAGQDFELKITLDSASNQEVYLAHYFLDNVYLDDSVKLDAGGTGVFARDTLLPQGLYKIYKDGENHFDFLLGADQQFSMSNVNYDATNAKIEGAVESQEFVKYIRFLKKLQNEGAEIRKKIETASQEEKTKLQTEMNSLTKNIHNYWFNTKKNFPDTFLSKFLLANYVPELDVSTLPNEVQQNDSLLLISKFTFQQEHFWDYFDYTDERFLYTPLLKPKIETWFTKVLYQNYDSVRDPVFNFIENTRANKRIFQFATSWFLNSSIQSNILGMDALFVDLARTYYLSGDAFWASDESMKIIRENVVFFEHNLIGKTAPDLTLESVDGEFVNLHKIKAKITAVLIYEPNCSHCKEFVPQLYKEVYLPFKDKGLEIFAIYSMDKKEEWVEFLHDYNLYGWINVWDEHHASQFKISYDARKTPGIYLLDENKKIIAKKLSVEQIVQFMKMVL